MMKPGDTFAIPLLENRFGICRIIKKTETVLEKKIYGENTWLVVPSHTIFEKLPLINEIYPDKNLYIENLKNQNKMSNPLRYLIQGYVLDAPPMEFIYLGNILLTEDEKSLIGTQSIDWLNIKNQWKKYTFSTSDAFREYENILKNNRKNIHTTQELTELRKESFFDNWEGLVKSEIISKAKNIFHRTIDALIKIDGKINKKAIQDVLQECILNFNALNKENNNFIETSEREEILNVFDEIILILNIENSESIINQREW